MRWTLMICRFLTFRFWVQTQHQKFVNTSNLYCLLIFVNHHGIPISCERETHSYLLTCMQRVCNPSCSGACVDSWIGVETLLRLIWSGVGLMIEKCSILRMRCYSFAQKWTVYSALFTIDSHIFWVFLTTRVVTPCWPNSKMQVFDTAAPVFEANFELLQNQF